MAISVPRRATTWPKPRPPSSRAVTAVSATTVMGDFGSMLPVFTPSAYWGMRITPWLSCARRLPSTFRRELHSASAVGAPRPSKMRVAMLSRRPASMVGMSDTIPHGEGRARARLPSRLEVAEPRDQDRGLLLPARRDRALRRRPPQGHLHYGPALAACHVGLGLPGDGVGARRAARDAAARRPGRRPAPGGERQRHRSHGGHGHLRAGTRGRPRRRGLIGLHPQARVALLRHGAREDLLGGGDALAERARAVRAAPHGDLSAAPRGGGRATVRCAAPRQLHHARVRLSPPARPGGERSASEGHRGLPHRVQVSAPRSQPCGLRAARPPRERARPPSPREMARPLRRGLHARARGDGDAGQARQRAPAHHGLLQGAPVSRGQARAPGPHRRLRARPRTADRAHHPRLASRGAPRHRLPRGPDLPLAAPEGADAPQPRLGAHGLWDFQAFRGREARPESLPTRPNFRNLNRRCCDVAYPALRAGDRLGALRMRSHHDLSSPPGAAAGPRSSSSAHGPARERFPWGYLGAFLFGTALISTFIWFQIEGERQTALAQWQARVTTVAEGRARLLSDWFKGRRADADVLASAPAVRSLMLDGDRGVDVGSQIVTQLDRVASAYGYVGISLMDPQGRILARSTGAADVGRENSEAAVAAAKSRAMHADLVEEGAHKFLVMSVPVFSDGGADPSRPAMGVVTLLMRPETRLLPLLADDTVPTRTGETLLFRVDRGKPSYASPLKGDSAAWSAVDRSLETLIPMAKRAAAGRDTFGEILDYRGTPTFVAVRWIVPPGWGLVVKVDREEALADFYQAAKLAGFAAGFLTLALAGLLFSLWRQGQRATLLRDQIKQERAIFNLKGYAEKIVASVPSGLLVLAADLRVLSANRSFLESFFLRREETLGRGLEDLVRAEGLVRRAREVIQTGTAQSDLPFDVYLPHRGESRPVRVTITSIRIEEQEDARLLLIIEDLSEEERLLAARRELEKRFQDLVQGLDAIVWEADATSLRFSFVSERTRTVLGFPTERWLEEPDFFTTRIHPEDRMRVMTAFRA